MISASPVKSRSFYTRGSIRLDNESEIACLFEQYSQEYQFTQKFLDADALRKMKRSARTPEAKKVIAYGIKLLGQEGSLDFSIG